jgi:hypothetical protein
MTYTPGGREVKHTRAANFVWRTREGNYLYWFHHHEIPNFTGQRNPAWIAGGREVDSPAGKVLEWTQPEILLYAPDTGTRMSYPDLIEEDGRYFVTETQKTIARVHEIPTSFLETLWSQPTLRQVAPRSLTVELRGAACSAGATAKLPAAFDLESTPADGGLTVEVWVRSRDWAPWQTLLDSRNAAGGGLSLITTDRGTVQLSLRGSFGAPNRDNAVVTESSWDCDPGLLGAGEWHHLVAIVDGLAKVVCFVVDGQLGDGGHARPFGWARLPRDLRTIPTTRTLRLAPSFRGELAAVRIYQRRLLVSEAIGNWRAGPDASAEKAR